MYKLLTNRIVLFIDTVMLFVDPEMDTLNENERREVILLFIQSAGLVELKESEQRGDFSKMTDRIYKAMGGEPRTEESYLSIARSCLSDRERCGVGNKWHYFATSLARIFAHEERSFFSWFVATIKTINYGIDYSFSPELDLKFQDNAIQFALDVVLNMDAERCAEHYLSKTPVSCRIN
jgi:hypothetical protein